MKNQRTFNRERPKTNPPTKRAKQMKKKIVSLERVVGWDDTALVLLKKTGVWYTAQCGGVSCTHPHAEGYAISIRDFAQDFDDCSYGCQYIGHKDNSEARMKLGKDFDTYCREKTKSWKWSIRFDFERVEETQEGWLPVIVNGMVDDFDDFIFENERGFIHNGNCD